MSNGEQGGKTSKTDTLEWIKVLVAVVGFGATIITYIVQRSDTQQTEARTRTLAQIDEFSKGKVSDAKKFVDTYWVTRVPAVVRDAQQLSTGDLVNTLEALASADSAAKDEYVKFKSNVAVVLDHFDYVSFCGQRGVCDPELVAAYYCKEFDSLKSAAIPTLEDYKKNKIRIGQNAQEYFGQFCDGAQPALTPLVAKTN